MSATYPTLPLTLPPNLHFQLGLPLRKLHLSSTSSSTPSIKMPSPRRSASPPPSSDKPKQWTQRRPKELSFYKSSARSYGQPSSNRSYEPEEESAKERAQRRERGEVPRRFGGTRDQGVRNTMGNVAAASVGGGGGMGSLKRGGDPLDRLGVRGSGDRDRERSERDRSDRDRDRGDRDRRDRDRDRERRRDDYGRERDYDRDRDRRSGPVDDDYRRPSDRDRERDRTSRPDMRHPDRQAQVPDEKDSKDKPANVQQISGSKVRPGRMIEVIANDRMGRKGESCWLGLGWCCWVRAGRWGMGDEG